MSRLAVRVDRVSKCFRRGTHASYLRFSERLLDAAIGAIQLPARVLNRGAGSGRPSDEFWALRELSCDVHEGEVVGIVGRNGAGKSTLLKILARITRPTAGRVGVRGRVGSLLEVGTGFHPELTGRENVFLNGAILGMSRREIRGKLDEITAFAEIGPFLDTPVKRYSSGMSVRLAFAIAAHLEPEVLLVDEVLAVGDYAFQRKCLGKLETASHCGRTVIFVSHNMAAVAGLCSRALLLDEGTLRADGAPRDVIPQYLSSSLSMQHQREWTGDDAPGGEKLRLRRLRVLPLDRAAAAPIDVRTPLEVCVEYQKLVGPGRANVGLYLYNLHGVCLFNTVSPLADQPAGQYAATVCIPGDLLNNGWHRLRVMLALDLVPQADVDGALTFEVHDVERAIPALGEWVGAVRPQLPWRLESTAR